MNFKELDSLDTFRISSIVALIFVSLLVLLSLTGLEMSSRLQVTPQFFIDPRILGESSQRTTLYSLKDSSGRSESGQKIIDEMLVRYYLMMRYEQIPDLPEMAFRWGKDGVIYLLSTVDVYSDFARQIQSTVASLPDMVQTVEIKHLERIKTDSGKDARRFSVDIVLHEQYPDGHVVSKAKTVQIAFGYTRRRRLFSKYLTNPYGFTISSFIESDNKSEKI